MSRLREAIWPRAITNVATRARFRNAPKNSPCRDTAHTCVMPPARRRNKHSGRALSCADRPSFPPPPRAWPAIVGAADGPISCALIFCSTHRVRGVFEAQRERKNVDGREKFTAGPATSGRTRLPGHDATEENYREIRPSAAARADAPCGRRTAPGWRPRRPPPAGTAWR